MSECVLNPSLSEEHFLICGEDAMVAFGELLGRECEAAGKFMCLFLEGDLGAGKTTLSRGILRAFGHVGAVKSPTYTLVEVYELRDRTLCHFDLYRLGDPEELEYMGIRDYFVEKNVCVIEWPERGAGILPKADLIVQLTPEGDGRRVHIQRNLNHSPKK